MSDSDVVDFTVRTGSAERLDDVLRQLPMARAQVVTGSWNATQKTCRVRVFGNAAFFRFALQNQGYGEVVDEQPVTT